MPFDINQPDDRKLFEWSIRMEYAIAVELEVAGIEVIETAHNDDWARYFTVPTTADAMRLDEVLDEDERPHPSGYGLRMEPVDPDVDPWDPDRNPNDPLPWRLEISLADLGACYTFCREQNDRDVPDADEKRRRLRAARYPTFHFDD